VRILRCHDAFGRRPRIKTAAQTIAELDNIYQAGWRGKIYFVDDNLMANRPYLKDELLPAVIRWKRDKRGISFHTQITMNLADDQELMDLMYEAGFDWIFIGIEIRTRAAWPSATKAEPTSELAGADSPLAAFRTPGAGRVIVGFDHDHRTFSAGSSN